MSGMPWYAFYPKDYRDKTSGLTMVQDCAYRRLMDEYYITGEPLEANADVLLRVCRAFDEAEKAAVLFILEKYFVMGDDGWHHLRIDEEIVKRAAVSQKRADAGKIGGRVSTSKANASANAQANNQAKPAANDQANEKHLLTHSHTHLSPVSSKEETGPSAVSRETKSNGEKTKSKPDDPWREVYRRGREILGESAGGVITNLRKTFDDKPRKVLAKLEDAAEQRIPLEWINAFLWQHGPPGLEGIDTGAMI